MPELPEVETVKNALAPHLQGKIIKACHFFTAGLRQKLDEELFNNAFIGTKIIRLKRRSKYLIFELDNNKWILSHLGMTGSWRLCPSTEARKKHEHISVLLGDGTQDLRYCDPRRFGEFRMITAPLNKDDDPQALAHLGPEPFDDAFNQAYLWNLSRNKTKAVKGFIMDPKTVCGIGNIYASETLFRCGISPLRKTQKLTKKDCHNLISHSQEVLQQAIAAGGTTIIDFQAPDGSEGWFHQQLNVYGRNGKKCTTCDKVIKRVVQTGRSSFYCPGCQK
ncbi:bifunctional DNA-formamidopyrimidine glycosylase/DNA-(apurinic or apyrimidinic site) lyase [Lentisphaera profundi]|uniref:Formamidopyrimidine-DNA glycosylase n=1 Tax=Lentisphaera profundi TaxID=1658616 RepID=A0ABY7VY74_9BACT|nr:bifunctional DNA-formamidopyrimidine glycosylase/DNA-(apurinic or apyrimidinic site) lyase [Lentisphaera profundi]WDE97018.1 bifunctional DNA-formamidopyrimidine glycosylase/DNA-(apurinic or apyrimidinic site) lyase [Lentisphaera profundi]